MFLTYDIGVSFNGRTADSGSADWGSNPCTPAQFENKDRGLHRVRVWTRFLLVRTS